MYRTVIRLRNAVERVVYKTVAKPIFFANDPEIIHDTISALGNILGKYSISQFITRLLFYYKSPALAQDILGIHFDNPVGLSAGFDKDGLLLDTIPNVGFGFMEVGTITNESYAGNSGVRLARLVKHQTLVVNYGLKSDGAATVAKRIGERKNHFPLGISLAPTNVSKNIDIDAAIADVLSSYKILSPLASYITINISCPNTAGEPCFLEPKNLKRLLTVLNSQRINKPFFIKLSPDQTDEEVTALLEIAKDFKIEGVICSNLLKKRPAHLMSKSIPAGGLSGKSVEEHSNRLIAYIYKRYGERFIIIGSGGVFTAADAYKKIRLGASLIQLITGMVFNGPQSISEINLGLVELLKRDGFSSVSEAIGVDIVKNP